MKRLYAVLALGIVLIAGATGAQAANNSNCFQQYQNDVLNCSYLQQPDQTLCNLDAATNLTGCIRRAIFG